VYISREKSQQERPVPRRRTHPACFTDSSCGRSRAACLRSKKTVEHTERCRSISKVPSTGQNTRHYFEPCHVVVLIVAQSQSDLDSAPSSLHGQSPTTAASSSSTENGSHSHSAQEVPPQSGHSCPDASLDTSSPHRAVQWGWDPSPGDLGNILENSLLQVCIRVTGRRARCNAWSRYQLRGHRPLLAWTLDRIVMPRWALCVGCLWGLAGRRW
jgi:hypothetical protein